MDAKEILHEFPDLKELDEKCAKLKISGDVFGAIKCIERSLFLRQHYFGFER